MPTTKDIQAKLYALGFYHGVIDDIKGPKTFDAIKAFQKYKGLVVDGIVGPKTLTALELKIETPKGISVDLNKRFNSRTVSNLTNVHPDLIKVLNEAVEHFSFTVICGYRGREAQEEAFRTGHSKCHYGASAHNYGLAVDCIPEPFKEADWNDEVRFKAMADAMLKAAKSVGIAITWGGVWKMHDTPHFELTDWKNMKEWNA